MRHERSAAFLLLTFVQEVVVARKRFKIPQGFVTEVRNLDILRESLSRHEGVMIHLATLIRGDDFNIFFPLADLDLRDFIYEEQAELSTFKCPAKLVDEVGTFAISPPSFVFSEGPMIMR